MMKQRKIYAGNMVVSIFAQNNFICILHVSSHNTDALVRQAYDYNIYIKKIKNCIIKKVFEYISGSDVSALFKGPIVLLYGNNIPDTIRTHVLAAISANTNTLLLAYIFENILLDATQSLQIHTNISLKKDILHKTICIYMKNIFTELLKTLILIQIDLIKVLKYSIHNVNNE